MSPPTTITLCMGSSCFSRGNGKSLPYIQRFLKENRLDTRVTLRGCRCGGCCSDGPNIWVNGARRSGMTGPALDAFLASLIQEGTGEPASPPPTP
jgi:NADH:ubiquinone oxidoreductase subunit E